MSDYTPSMGGMREAYHRWAIVNENVVAPSELDAEFDRFIAKIKADALREAAGALPKPVGLNCNEECHNVDWASLRVRADRIEEAINEWR